MDSLNIYLDSGLYYKKQGNLKLSVQHYKNALQYANSNDTKADIYNNLGIIYKNQAKYDPALDSYFEAERITQNREILVLVFANIAVVNSIIGDYTKAIIYNEKALSFVTNKKWEASILNNIANIHYSMKDFNTALSYYKKSFEIKIKHDPANISYSYLNMALCLESLNNKSEADLYFDKTIQERRERYGKNDYRLIKAYTNYGNFLAQKNQKKSFDLLSRANKLSLLNFGEKHPETSKTYNYLGNYYQTQNKYETALSYYQKALISNSKYFNDANFIKNPNIKDAISELQQLDILHQKAIALKHLGNLKNDESLLNTCLTTYRLAIKVLFKLQNSFMDESKRTLIADKKNMFVEAAYIAIQLGDYPKAFQLIEKGKASTLLAAVNNNEAIRFGNIPDSLVRLENEYKRLQFVYAANDVADSVLFYQERYDSLVSYFETHYKKYYNLKYGNEFTDPCKQLDTNQVLLEYALIDTLCITLVVTKEGYKHYSFPVDSTFNKNTEEYIRLLNYYNLDSQYKEQYHGVTSLGYYLWQKLIKPLHIPNGKSLIIVPDGILSYLNFETLLYELKDDPNMNYYLLKYLLYKHPISYSYSGSWLFEPYNESPDKNIIAFAADYKDKDSLMTLLHTVDEVKKITNFFRGKSYINERCTKAAFLANASDYRIIHMALHGDVDKKNPDNSIIAFYDDNLYSWEVYGMNLKAQMAYLGACKTGDGMLDKGEGVFSMGRAFAYAGCHTVVMSLWADKDKLSHVTLDFYKYLRKGYCLDKAMQQAKINHLKQKFDSHPHFWSNKIVMGKTKPINKQCNYWLFALFIIPLYVFYVKVIKK